MATARERYEKLANDRIQFLQRARHNALLTIPSLMPLEGHDGRSHLIEPYNGLGSHAVIHLSSRITMNLLPAGRPHMRLDLPAEIKLQQGGKTAKEVENGLALAEGMIQGEVERLGWRPSTLQSVQQLLVAGNVCEHFLPNGQMRVFRLDQFVVKRDFAGQVIEGVIEEKLTPLTVPKDVHGSMKEGVDPDEEVRLYTWIRWDRPREVYKVTQEINGSKTGLEAEYTLREFPYLFLRWSQTPGEDYGRAKVEEHAADFRSLDGLEKAGLEMAAMAARNIIAIRPGSVASTVKRRIAQAINGDVILVDPDNIELKSFENPTGYQIVDIQVQKIVDRISRAFLLLSAGQRDAERVTATEIERDIAELEAALGGNFSNLNRDMMERRTDLLTQKMTRDEQLPPEILTNTQATILTGVEALSRERDVARVMNLAQIAAAFGENVARVELNLNKLLGRAASGLGMADVINSPDEKAAIQQQMQAETIARQAAGPAAGGAMRAAAQGGGQR